MTDPVYLITDATGTVVSVCGVPQSMEQGHYVGCAQTVVDLSDPRVIAFLAPSPIAPPKPTPLQWLKRLSPAKQQAVFTTALQTPALLGSLFMADGVGPAGIDVTDPQTIALVGAWVQTGTLDATDQALLLAP